LTPDRLPTFIRYFFRYQSLRYQVGREEITMRWGVHCRREISLNYARIQDIHLSSNFVERWLGLARIQVQTASGSATAEMTIEGLTAYEDIRNFLYSRMRGARDDNQATDSSAEGIPTAIASSELEAILRETAAEVRAIRETLERRISGSSSDG
jgi:putative membrane protein